MGVSQKTMETGKPTDVTVQVGVGDSVELLDPIPRVRV